MSSCELCGYEGNLLDAIIEGSLLRVCRNCCSFGKVVPIQHHTNVPDKTTLAKLKRRALDEADELIVEHYSGLIKEEREKRKLTQEELAKAIHEKESIIHKLESGQMLPPLALARKLEHFLHITLIHSYQDEEKPKINFSDKALTIGDLIKVKKT